MKDEGQLEKNKEIKSVPQMGKVYSVSFDVKPTSFEDGLRSVLHLTTGGDAGKYGDRIPAVYFHGSKGTNTERALHICSSLGGVVSKCYTTKKNIPVNTWATLKIFQKLVDDKYVYYIDLNGDIVYTEENTDARTFKNVKVYAADPWSEPQPGSIRNLIIRSEDVTGTVITRKEGGKNLVPSVANKTHLL